jgi:hypothetical protein
MTIREASPLGHYPTLPAGGHVPWVCQEGGPPEPPTSRFLGRVRHASASSSSTATATPPRWMPVLTITPRTGPDYHAGARRISWPSGSGAFSMVAER